MLVIRFYVRSHDSLRTPRLDIGHPFFVLVFLQKVPESSALICTYGFIVIFYARRGVQIIFSLDTRDSFNDSREGYLLGLAEVSKGPFRSHKEVHW